MTEQTRRVLILACVLLIAALLAFPLRETLYQAIIIPSAFVAWNLNRLYYSFSQSSWWWVIVFIVLFLLSFSLVPQAPARRQAEVKADPPQGQVEGLARSLQKAQRGIYFKWLIANRLGKLAYQILLHRESGRPPSFFTPLTGADWEPSQELQAYLETGLRGSFADFPQDNRPLSTPQKTPLDLDIAEAVEFLESHLENGKPK